MKTTWTMAQIAMPSYGMCQPIRRVACHHCGNIRKNQVKCIACPQLYCRNCSEKIKQEHGTQVFANGCPVCKKLCCCAEKSPLCTRQNHCYRKCPVSKLTKAITANSSSMSHSPSAHTSLPSNLVDKKESDNNLSLLRPTHNGLALNFKQQDNSNSSASMLSFPLEILAAAACEQFETNSNNDTVNYNCSNPTNNNDSTYANNNNNTIACSSTDEQTTVEDISDISSADGDFSIQIKATADNNNNTNDIILNNKNNNKRPISALDSSNISNICTNNISINNQNSMASSFIPIPLPMEWWALQNNLQMNHTLINMNTSDVSNARNNTLSKIIWLPVFQPTVNTSDNSNNHTNNAANDTKIARSNGASLAPLAVMSLPWMSLESRPRLSQDSRLWVYDWVLRPSHVRPSPTPQSQAQSAAAVGATV